MLNKWFIYQIKIFKMKKYIIALYCTVLFFINVNSQTANTFDNYFAYHDYMMDYFNDQAIQQNILYTEVDGWKEFFRWKMDNMHRHDEFGDFTPYAEAIYDYYNNFQDNETNDSPKWEYFGHEGIYKDFNNWYSCAVGQGNINRIWVNENNLDHILAGGNHGSLWKTIDGGDNWVCISDSEPLMDGHASIEVNSANTNEIYVAQRSKNISTGLFHTTDGGVSWTNNKVFVTANSEHFYPSGDKKKLPVKWIINPNNDQIMFLLTNGFLLRSLNGGSSWEIITDEDYNLDNGKRFTDIEFDPSDPTIFYVGGPEVFKYTGSGSTQVDISYILPSNTSGKYTVAIGTHSTIHNYIWFTIFSYGGLGFPNKICLNKLDKLTGNYPTLASTTTSVANFEYDKIQCEISPVDETRIMIGRIDAHMCKANTSGVYSFYDISQCNQSMINWIHHDVRDAKFLEDEDGDEVLIVGCDGGVFSGTPSPSDEWTWTYLANDGTNGIRNSDILGFDYSGSGNDELVYVGLRDMRGAIKSNDTWHEIFNADATSGIINKSNSDKIYGSKINGETASFYRSTIGGSDFSSQSQMFEVNVGQPPILFKPNDQNCIYVGDNQKLQRYTNIWTASAPLTGVTILSISDDQQGIDYYGDLKVRNLAICESNSNVIYASTQRYFPEIVTYEKALYKTTNAGLNWTDISSNLLNGLQYGSITGLAINPDNQNEIWACFGGVASSTNANLAKKVYHSVNAGVSWVPMASGLPEEIPANDIYYDHLSDRLYLATDVGMFFCEADEGIWYNFSDGLPPTNVDMIRFNYDMNKIGVATKGRGIWQAEIPCYSNDNTITISSNETWDTERHEYSDIVVETGVTLTITDILHMAADKKIIVERGAKLVLDGGTITSSYCGLWQGVQVYGNASQSQSYSYQGGVEIINDGTIENAVCGIETIKYTTYGTPDLNYTGGIIGINGGIFKNNTTAIKFWNYSYATSLSMIGNCQFIADDNIIAGTDPGNFVELSFISGVRFISSSFTDDRSGISTTDLITGINCYDSYINVFQGCEFTDLNYGIYATASTTTINIDIKDSEFIDNYRGIYIGGMTDPRVTSNIFDLKYNYTPFTDGYGLYLDESTGYWVEDNTFNNCDDCGTTRTGVGIIVNESGKYPNEIYLNVFNDVENAINVQGNNRSSTKPDDGLVIKCNEYNNTKADETIIWSGRITTTAGIARSQGADTDEIEDMAGNIFHYETSATDYDDLDNEANSFYYYYSDDPGTNDVEPLDAQFNITVFPEEQPTQDPWTHATACLSTIHTGGGGGGGLEDGLARMSESQTEIESTEAILTAMIDGGDTEALNTEVETSTPPETVAVYNELMNESPNLSETVVESSIEKENVLPNAMVRDVMVANPHSAKSQQLIDKLDERLDPMPEYMKAQILAGRSIQSLKDEMESKLANSKRKKANAMNDVIRYYTKEETDPLVAYNGLVNLFQDDNTLKSSYRLAWLYLEKGEYQLGAGVISNIPTQFSLTDDEQLVYAGMADIYSMLSALYQSGNTIEDLSETQVSQLQNLASGEVLTTRAYARNILMAIGEMEYQEPILFADHSKSAMVVEDYNKLMKTKAPQQLSVYPNPSTGYVILEYNMEIESDAVLEIKDVNGKTIRTINTSQKLDQVTVTTEDWKPGLYIATLKINGKSIESVKFTVVK